MKVEIKLENSNLCSFCPLLGGGGIYCNINIWGLVVVGDKVKNTGEFDYENGTILRPQECINKFGE